MLNRNGAIVLALLATFTMLMSLTSCKADSENLGVQNVIGIYSGDPHGIGLSPRHTTRLMAARLVQTEAVNTYHSMVSSAAMAAGVPAHLAHGVIRTESNYNPALRGRAGEYGIGQIKCQTARGVGFTGNCAQLLDAATNLTYSMRYLRLAIDRGGAGCAGVSLYQRGVYGRASCSGYGRMVMSRAGG